MFNAETRRELAAKKDTDIEVGPDLTYAGSAQGCCAREETRARVS